jgi:hypothetical protein
MEKPPKKLKKTPTKSLKKAPSTKPKKTSDAGKIPPKSKSAPRRKVSSGKTVKPKKIVLAHQHKRNLNTGIMKILVPGLPRGRMNSMYDEATKTDTIWKIGWKPNVRSSRRKYLKGHKVGR